MNNKGINTRRAEPSQEKKRKEKWPPFSLNEMPSLHISRKKPKAWRIDMVIGHRFFHLLSLAFPLQQHKWVIKVVFTIGVFFTCWVNSSFTSQAWESAKAGIFRAGLGIESLSTWEGGGWMATSIFYSVVSCNFQSGSPTLIVYKPAGKRDHLT